MSKQWYVIQAYSNYEKKVKQNLEYIIEEKNKQDFFGKILIPTETVIDVVNTKEKTSQSKFFPGYVLIEMQMNDDTWSLVNSVDKVVGFLGGSIDHKKGEIVFPNPLSQEELDAIMQKVSDGSSKPKLKVMYQPGNSVSITDGPFDGFSGLVQSVDYEKSNLQVEVQILGRSTVIQLNFSQVSKD